MILLRAEEKLPSICKRFLFALFILSTFSRSLCRLSLFPLKICVFLSSHNNIHHDCTLICREMEIFNRLIGMGQATAPFFAKILFIRERKSNGILRLTFKTLFQDILLPNSSINVNSMYKYEQLSRIIMWTQLFSLSTLKSNMFRSG